MTKGRGGAQGPHPVSVLPLSPRPFLHFLFHQPFTGFLSPSSGSGLCGPDPIPPTPSSQVGRKTKEQKTPLGGP